VPVDRLTDVWRREKLNGSIQLTISGCLGPCDLANVVLVITPTENIWLGDLCGKGAYEELIAWARACAAADRVLPLPAALANLRFERHRPELAAV
jgi:cobaltochelatase CobN